MATYNKGLLAILDGTIDPIADTIKILIVSPTYTFDREEQFVADTDNEVTNSSGTGYSRKTLSGKTWNLTPVLSVTDITRSTTTATATTSVAHGYSVDDEVVIKGADQTEYNGRHTITAVPTTTTFEYTVSGSPVSPATGTITVGRDFVYFDFDNVSYTAIDTNEELSKGIIYKEITDDTDSPLIACFEFPDISTNGSDIELQVDTDGAFRVKNLTE